MDFLPSLQSLGSPTRDFEISLRAPESTHDVNSSPSPIYILSENWKKERRAHGGGRAESSERKVWNTLRTLSKGNQKQLGI